MPSCFRRGAGGDLWERGALLSSAQPGEKGTAPFPSVRQKGALLSTAREKGALLSTAQLREEGHC